MAVSNPVVAELPHTRQRYRRLRAFNVVAGVLLAAEASYMLAASNDLALPVTARRWLPSSPWRRWTAAPTTGGFRALLRAHTVRMGNLWEWLRLSLADDERASFILNLHVFHLRITGEGTFVAAGRRGWIWGQRLRPGVSGTVGAAGKALWPGTRQRRRRVDRIVESHGFGPHRVDILERADDEGATYVVLVDDVVVTDSPLPARPRFEDVVRIYAKSQGQG